MQTGGAIVGNDCYCCACKASLIERTTKLERDLAVLETRDAHQTALLENIKEGLDGLITDKQRFVGAVGLLSIIGAGIGGILLWVADKVIDQVFK